MPDADADDADLLALCRIGDADAWRTIVGRYRRLVRSISASNGVYGADADEIEQIVFSILVQQLDRLRPDTRLAAWLSVVTRRHVWRLVRKRQREVVTEDVGATQFHHEVDDALDKAAVAEWVRTGLVQLSERCRTLIEALFLTEDPSYAMIASDLGIPIGSIGPTRQRCLDRLREILAAAETSGHDVGG